MHFFLMHNDPLALSCSLAFLGEWSHGSWRSLAKNFSSLLLRHVFGKLQQRIRTLSWNISHEGVCQVCRDWCYILAELLSVSACHVLCIMLEMVLRTCPDGAVFLFFRQATGGFNMVSSDQILITFAFNMDLKLAAKWAGDAEDSLTSQRSPRIGEKNLIAWNILKWICNYVEMHAKLRKRNTAPS